LCLAEEPPGFLLREGESYTLQIEASASNAEPVSARFDLSVQDGEVRFGWASPVDPQPTLKQPVPAAPDPTP
jgi:hypothetical protein